jgi:ferric-dicitrate binding protein FerR (iron transport regulator)
MEQDVIAMRVKELRQEIAELTRYYEESVSPKPSLIQERLQGSRIERLEETKRELAKLREIPERTIQRTITSE